MKVDENLKRNKNVSRFRKYNKTAVRDFFRAALCTLTAIVVPTLTFYGMKIADERTRIIGYSDMPAAFSFYENSDGYHLTVFGYKLDCQAWVSQAVDYAFTVYEKSAPWSVKASLALIDVTERTSEQFLEQEQ